MKESLTKIIYFCLSLILIYLVFVRPFMGPGLIAGGDWISPYSSTQLKHYGLTWDRLWNDYTLPTGSQIAHKNLYLYELLIHLVSFMGISGVIFQKFFVIFLVLLIFSSSLRLFHRITKNFTASLIGALAYLFSPIVFNYFIMGWVYVLLFLGLMPLFIHLWMNFVEKNSYSSLIGLSIIAAIAFFQAQSIFWIPLLLVICSISYLPEMGWRKTLAKFLVCSFAIGIMMVVVHGSWYYPVALFPEKTITAATGTNDIHRFSTVSGLSNQLIAWGSLWNEQFELSFLKILKPVVYLPIFAVIFLVILKKKNQKPDYQSHVFLSLLLVLIAPLFYIFRYPVAALPLSIIIRDSSRFIIFTNLGLALGICLFWQRIKLGGAKFYLLIALALLIHPFLLNRLTTPGKSVYGVSEFSKDQRIRMLENPWKENEELIVSEKTQRGIYFPTGGFVSSENDPRFKVSFSWTGDLETFYTPNVSGFLISDKSNSKTEKFTKYYLELAKNNKTVLKKLSRIYGIDKIFVRLGLGPTDPSSPSHDWTMPGCRQTGLSTSDWSIGQVCDIPDPYPLLFASSNPIIASSSAFYDGLIRTNLDSDYLVSIDCVEQPDLGICKDAAKPPLRKRTSPQIAFELLGPTKYSVTVDNIASDFVLVLNQTYHPGWVIKNQSGQNIDRSHLLVNQLVNGWHIPFEGTSSAQYIIEFHPDILFARLVRVSLLFLLMAVLGWGGLFFFERRKQP